MTMKLFADEKVITARLSGGGSITLITIEIELTVVKKIVK